VEKDESSRLAGRRTLGPAPKPGSRYSIFVGLAFLAVVIIAFTNMITTRDSGTLGLDEESSNLPLPEFAVPVAASELEGDANIAQDDCETSELPCPADARRTPACRVPGADVIRVCDLFGRPLVISFWFTRGSDCEPQQDVVSEVYERYRGRVNFLSLNVRDDRDAVRELARERGWQMPLGHDRDGAVSNLYRVGGCPTFVYAYPGGILESAGIGELSEAELSANVRRLLRESHRVTAAGS
jgi:cytochrome c biogenesis protein CcmG, thiol:disulfide interchange protein DsbE